MYLMSKQATTHYVTYTHILAKHMDNFYFVCPNSIFEIGFSKNGDFITDSIFYPKTLIFDKTVNYSVGRLGTLATISISRNEISDL